MTPLLRTGVTIVVLALAITGRLLRDHLDKERALFGLVALSLIPFYTFKADELNANTVTMPFWPAALLFYLRARRDLGALDAILAGACAGLALLGKYWAVYLFAGMAVASLAGAGTRRFWRSPAPYLMAAGAAVVIAPHLLWYVSEGGGANAAFMRDSVMTNVGVGAALGRSAHYLLGCIAFAIGPLVLFAALRPSRAALADVAWPADAARRQAVILFAVPLLLPALANLVEPHRLTDDWTFPNWALLPIVLYGSRKIAVDAAAVATAGLVALALSLLFLIVSPFVAYYRLAPGGDHDRPNSRQVAEAAARLTDKPVQFYWGSGELVAALPFYLPNARPLDADPLSEAGRAEIKAGGALIVCREDDAPCLATDAELAGEGAGAGRRTADLAIRRSFLGFSAPPIGFRITVEPAERN